MTESAREALSNLRNASDLQWYVVPIFAFVAYIYANEIEKRDWSVLLGGLAYWGMEWFNEIANALFFHFNGFAPLWGVPGKSAYIILVGLNIEICLAFGMAGIIFLKILPRGSGGKIWHLNNRLLVALAGSTLMVCLELLFNKAGLLTWEYYWWSGRTPWVVVLFGYMPLFLISFWVFDMEKVKTKAFAVGTIFCFNIICLTTFGFILKWI